MSARFTRPSSSDAAGQLSKPQELERGKGDNMAGHSSKENVTIILSTTIPSVFLIIVAAVLFRRARRRRARFLNRGITPIDDEEIESWKVDRTPSADEEKGNESPKSAMSDPKRIHQTTSSVGSVHKPPSVIIYQNHSISRRGSEEQPPWSPTYRKGSTDVPPTPVLARAPNSRPGLTDETVQGDDAFLPPNFKRSQARLAKLPAGSPRHIRTRSARSSLGGSAARELWYTQTPDQHSPRPSLDTFSRSSPPSRGGRRATVSTPTHVRSSFDDDVVLSGLSPRPLIHRSEIGRAIG